MSLNKVLVGTAGTLIAFSIYVNSAKAQILDSLNIKKNHRVEEVKSNKDTITTLINIDDRSFNEYYSNNKELTERYNSIEADPDNKGKEHIVSHAALLPSMYGEKMTKNYAFLIIMAYKYGEEELLRNHCRRFQMSDDEIKNLKDYLSKTLPLYRIIESNKE